MRLVDALRCCLLKSPYFLFDRDEGYLSRFASAEWSEYEHWLYRHRLFTLESLRRAYREARALRVRPLVSILMPVYNPRSSDLHNALKTILWQTYPNWELCITDDSSTDRDYLRKVLLLRDRRVRVFLGEGHAGIARNTQIALEHARGEFVAMMDQDDELYPDALASFVRANQERPIDYFYSDRDMISPAGRRYMHFLKPDWSPEYLLSFNYIQHLEVMRRSLVQAVGGLRAEFEGSQDYDLTLRLTEKTDRIHHHPMVLYSWRQSEESVARNQETKPYAYVSGGKAIREAARRRGLPVADVFEQEGLHRGHYRFKWDKDRLLQNRRIRLVAVSESNREAGRLTMLFRSREEMSAWQVDFLEARPAGLRHTMATFGDDDVVLFCDEPVTAISELSLADIAGYLSIPGVGIVGCKFVDGEGRIHNAGLAVSASGKLLYAYRGKPADEVGYGAVCRVARNASLVHPAFWAAKAGTIRELGGLPDAAGFGTASALLFLRALERGRRAVMVPHTCLQIDAGRAAKGLDEALVIQLWKERGLTDAYYHPMLTDQFEDFGLQL